MNKSKNDQFVWFGASITVHLFVLTCIFVSLQHKPSFVHKPKDKNFAFKVPAPIIFYGQQMAPNKRPGSLPKTTQAVSGQQQSKTTQKPQPETIKPKQSAPTTKKALTVNPTKQNPSLADIFNHARQNFTLPKKTPLQIDGDGAGQPLVIREGDMQYYSLWSTFLTHLNNAARFNRIKSPAPITEWIQLGLLKNNLQCGITINKKGEVQDISIILSSGHVTYDELCIQDIWSASPFPPLPDQLGKKVARFEVRSYI